MGRHRKKICPGCGEYMDSGATRCRACYNKQRAENKWPYHRGKTPMKLCPGCKTNWIIKYSGFCRDCYNLRRTKAWKEAVSQFAEEHDHLWVPHDTYHQCAICGLKEPHYWVLDELTNYGICKFCGAERQFPTPREQVQIMAQHRFRPQIKQVPVLLDEEGIPEMI